MIERDEKGKDGEGGPKFTPIHVNGKLVKADKKVMTGLEIKRAAELGEGDRLFLVTPGGNPRPVANDEPVTLHPGMHFRSMVDGNLG